VEGLIVTISRVSPLILRKVGRGQKPVFSEGVGLLPAPPVKFLGGAKPPKPPPP